MYNGKKGQPRPDGTEVDPDDSERKKRGRIVYTEKDETKKLNNLVKAAMNKKAVTSYRLDHLSMICAANGIVAKGTRKDHSNAILVTAVGKFLTTHYSLTIIR